MSIEYFAGTEGPTIVVENRDEVIEVLDIIHTQIMDNESLTSNERVRIMNVLEKAMDELREL